MADEANEAAQSVAEAVKRVADAAVAEVQKVPKPGKSYDFAAVSGKPGGRVVIRGSGFGPGGSVHINGSQLETTSWSTSEIIGKLPASANKDGLVVVHVDDKVTRTGLFKSA